MDRRKLFLLAGAVGMGGVASMFGLRGAKALTLDAHSVFVNHVPVLVWPTDLRSQFRAGDLQLSPNGTNGVGVGGHFWNEVPVVETAPGAYHMVRTTLMRDAYDSEIRDEIANSPLQTRDAHLAHAGALVAGQMQGYRGHLPVDKPALFYLDGSESALLLQLDPRWREKGIPFWNAHMSRKDRVRSVGTEIFRLYA
ncbi:MAG: hypothetical protein JWM46_846 [Candidatus Kaiserbacteria bacterium]|nr:hypothetical protein [Candidatus Kaiserbacteria bacterium]